MLDARQSPPPSAVTARLELHGVTKQFRVGRSTVDALTGVDLAVGSGEIHGVVGPSGAGKSTLIRCLSLLERPTTGAVVLEGVDVTELSDRRLRSARRRIGMVFQRDALLDSRTAAGNVAYPLEVAGVSRRQRAERVAELLELVGLGDRGDSHPAQLSGGQRQRVGIARALAAEPSVLLCDEPTSALDPTTTAQILDLIATVRDRLELAVVLVTHEMDAVRRICDSVSLLEGGRVVERGAISAIAADPAGPLAQALVRPPPVRAGAGQALLEVSYGSSTSTTDVLRAILAVADEAVVAAATVEHLHGHQVGRLRLLVDDAAGGEIARRLVGAGLDVTFDAASDQRASVVAA